MPGREERHRSTPGGSTHTRRYGGTSPLSLSPHVTKHLWYVSLTLRHRKLPSLSPYALHLTWPHLSLAFTSLIIFTRVTSPHHFVTFTHTHTHILTSKIALTSHTTPSPRDSSPHLILFVLLLPRINKSEELCCVSRQRINCHGKQRNKLPRESQS